MTQNENLAIEVGNLLKKHNLTFCAAESCTGGLLLSTLTDIAGSSSYILGGIVSYSYESKQHLIHVREKTLLQYGAVSEETAREMVLGVRSVFNADVAVSITGIAGPDGGMPEKPVGLTYIGVATASITQVSHHVWNGSRVENKQQSVAQALRLVVEILDKIPLQN
jgi:nicotinamide-nucleotide amidase